MNKLAVLLLVIFTLPLSTSAVPSPGTGTIVNTAFTIGAGQFVAYPIAVHPRGGQVFGRFRAQGGGRNDIECFIVDEDGLENFSNGHSVPTFYRSGRTTVGRLNVVLRSGSYFLVFSNRFSLMTPKAVRAAIFIKLPSER